MRYPLPRLVTDQTGRISLAAVLLTVGGTLLFMAMAAVGFSVTDVESEVPTMIVADVTAIPGDEEVALTVDPTEQVIADELVRALQESGQASAETIDRVAEEVGSSGGSGSRGSSGGSRELPTVQVISDVEVIDGADPASGEEPDGSGTDEEPAPVPEEVLGEDYFLRHFVDWDRIRDAERLGTIRFDPCAGSVPGIPPLPGCPSGTGATIVPVDGEIDGEPLSNPFSVLSAPAYPIASRWHPSCGVDGTFRIQVTTNRPARLSVTAWNTAVRPYPNVGEPPATARTFDVTTSEADADAWNRALSDESGVGPSIHHCIDLPDIEFGNVSWLVEGSSLYLPDAAATASTTNSATWWNRGVKPPSALIATTPQTLYVRAWSRSAVSEQIFVQARPASPEGCDNLGDISLVGGAPGGAQGVLDRVFPMDGSGIGWPWDPAWDEMQIHRLILDPGTQYDVCIFWVNDTGPSFNPSSVTLTEAAQVVTPSPNTLTMYVNGGGFADLGGDPRVNGIAITGILSGPAYYDPDIPTTVCSGAWDTNSTIGRIEWTSDVLCETDDVTGLIVQRGMHVIASATDSLGDRYRRSSWIPLPSNFFRCGAPCGEQSVLAYVPLPWVAPRTITGSFDWPFDLETDVIFEIDEDERGQDGPPVGSVTVELVSTPTGAEARNWVLGEIGEITQSDRRLPLRPQLDVSISYPTVGGDGPSLPGIHFPEGFPGVPHGVVQVRVEADRPVSLGAVVGEHSFDELCLRTTEPPSYTAAAPAVVHTFQLSGLCPIRSYNLLIAAEDETGTPAEIFGVGTADGSTPVGFAAKELRLSVHADLAIDPSVFGPGTEGARPHLSHGDVYVVDPESRRRLAVTNLVPSRSLVAEQSSTGWTFDDPYRDVICADPSASGGELLAPAPLESRISQPGGYGDVAAVSFDVRRFSAGVSNRVTAVGHLIRCSTAPRDEVVNSIRSTVDIVDLLTGLTLTAEDGSFTLELIGVPTP